MYYGLTVAKKNGKTYWQKAQKSQEKVRQHAERYVHKPCHLVIFRDAGGELEFDGIWPDFKK